MQYTINHVPISKYHRPGTKTTMQYITVHNTAVPGAPAINLRSSLGQPNNKRYASWHICVDANQAIECLPLNEVAYHAGDGNGNGNMHSIGIEVCEVDGAEQAAIELIVKMLKERGWGIDRVKKHQDWSGKYCPRLIIPHWAQFINSIQVELQGGNRVERLIIAYGDGDVPTATIAMTKFQCGMITREIFDNNRTNNIAKVYYIIGGPESYNPGVDGATVYHLSGADRIKTALKALS